MLMVMGWAGLDAHRGEGVICGVWGWANIVRERRGEAKDAFLKYRLRQ